jgi:hypothetical protein
MRTTTKTTARKNAAPKNVAAKPVPAWSYGAMKEAIASYQLPAWVSTTVSILGGLLTAGSTYYAGMLLIDTLIGLTVGLPMAALIAFLIYFIGLIVNLMLAIYSGAQVQQWIHTGGPRAIIAAPARFVSWLGRAKAAVAATE